MNGSFVREREWLCVISESMVVFTAMGSLLWGGKGEKAF